MLGQGHVFRSTMCNSLRKLSTGSSVSNFIFRKGFLPRVPVRNVVLYQKVKSTFTDKLNPGGKRNLLVEEGDSPKVQKHKRRVLIIGGITFTALAGFLFYEYFSWSSGDTGSKNEEDGQPSTTKKVPSDPNDIPKKAQYLLIGGGTASFSAFRAIKISDPTAKVLVVSNEPFLPYMRPPLSKEMWYQAEKQIENLRFKQWNGTERSLFFEPEEFYIGSELLAEEPKGGISVIRGWTVTKLDAEKKIAVLDDGTEIQYEKCLLATGIHPKNLPVFEDASERLNEKITVFRNVQDFQRLQSAMKGGVKSIAVIGGSFLGSELACAFSRNGASGIKVIQVYPEKGNLGRIMPAYLSAWITDRIRAQGVEIIPNVEIEKASLSSSGKQVEMQLSNGSTISADHVVVAVGSEANTDLAECSGLELHPELGGFVVNSELAARTDLYAAGDCACFYDPQLGRRRIEHHDHAVTSGRLAGENMTGARKSYAHQSMFWSDLGPDIGFEAIGEVDANLPTVAIYAKPPEQSTDKLPESNDDEKEKSQSNSSISTSLPKVGDDYSKGVLFYLRDDFIVGIVLWNIFNRSMIARQILREHKKFDDLNEVAKLFDIHEDDDDDDNDED